MLDVYFKLIGCRPETEQWTAELIWQLKAHLQETRKPVRILDLCSGSGCISLAIAYQLGRFIERANIADVGVYIEGVDINPLATQLAQMNAKHLCNDLKNVKVHFRTGDLFGKEFAEHYHSNRFDLIVSAVRPSRRIRKRFDT
jgi:release factor glutamine methyltransferase